jgi:ParB-like chromosome segregation protein Spo0J
VIVPSRWQPREPVFDGERLWELARSIEEQGLINAVVVFPVEVEEDPSGFGKPQGSYELVAGERRVRAVLGLAWGKIAVGLSEKAAVEALARDGLTGLPAEARELLEAAGARIMARVEMLGDGLKATGLERAEVGEESELRGAEVEPVGAEPGGAGGGEYTGTQCEPRAGDCAGAGGAAAGGDGVGDGGGEVG